MIASLLFILSAAVFAQDDFDLSVVDQLRERERKALNAVLEAKKDKYNREQKEALAVQTSDILSSPTFRGFVKRGAMLVELKSDEQLYLPRDIYVKAHILEDASGYLFLQNKEGIATHKTLASNVSNIETVTQMHEPPPYYEPVVRTKTESRIDTGLELFTELNLHLGLSSPDFTRDLVNDTSSSPGRLVRYEVQGYSPFTLPVALGASFMIENTKGDLGPGGQNYSLTSFSIGPILKSRPFELWDHKLVGTLGLRTSISSRLEESRTQSSARYSLAQTTLFLGLQKETELALGSFVWGANFQRQWSKASSDRTELDINPDNRYDDSFSISVGHRMEWL